MRRATNSVASAAQQLDEMCTLAARDLDERTLGRIRELIDVTSERSEVDPSWCVIGMLGGTGAGKSSLVNALSGGEVVMAGVRRPTTNEACAVLPRGREPQELLGWLGIGRRVEAPEALPGDTVLVDLPDIDSVEASHAEITDRLASRVDALVVVVNPQKYADARLHDEWLARLRSSHASVTVVLTHIDTVSMLERESIEQDLRRLLGERGLANAEVFAVSSTTGEGVPTLIKHLTREAERVSRQASRARAALGEAARVLRESLELSGTVRGLETDGLASELAGTAADLAGAPIIAEAVEASTLRAGRRAGGWLPLRWLARDSSSRCRRRRRYRPVRLPMKPLSSMPFEVSSGSVRRHVPLAGARRWSIVRSAGRERCQTLHIVRLRRIFECRRARPRCVACLAARSCLRGSALSWASRGSFSCTWAGPCSLTFRCPRLGQFQCRRLWSHCAC